MLVSMADPALPPLPGGVSVSRLRVYDWQAPDGLRGGTPHLHLACTEAYVVLGGNGAVQTLTASGYAETELVEDAVVWFTPGTIHRLVNADGRLDILVLMQNAGLPEAGDAVFPFPPDVLYDDAAYARAARLDPAEPEKSAQARRDLALAGFAELARAARAGDTEPLTAFHTRAVELVRPHLDDWRGRWERGPAAAAAATDAHLDALRTDGAHLRTASVQRTGAESRFGMCGRLQACDLDGAVTVGA
ncbi:cupin domain-containing protein [Streptomyces phytophilus]|uniref:cupin domain-containing protein n=1 Tax=Streptomyces phytophilus TaxID=722715 RepID=UPI0015F05C76|nr:cupin [Streptomyces phytophilus]